jgi:hypothetical protein
MYALVTRDVPDVLCGSIRDDGPLPEVYTDALAAQGAMRSYTVCVDSSEFVVSKLKDRGPHQAFGVVTNAQDVLHILRLYVERELAVAATVPD